MTRKLFIYWLLLLIPQGQQAQRLINLNKIKWNQNAIYLVTRGSLSKGALIANQFNISDKCATHVGIGILENGSLRIFHVTNEENDSPSALARETLESFANLPDAEYLGIWEYQATTTVLQQLRNLLYAYFAKHITFDFNFNADDDESMYCSEFCAKILKTLHPNLDYPLVDAQLDAVYRVALDRETLHYWPVDFFEYDGKFVKVYETWIY